MSLKMYYKQLSQKPMERVKDNFFPAENDKRKQICLLTFTKERAQIDLSFPQALDLYP